MSEVQTFEASFRDVGERFEFISAIMSESFRATYTAHPIGIPLQPSIISAACSDGVSICRANMTPLKLTSEGEKTPKEIRYFITFLNNSSTIRVGNSSPFHLRPFDIVIFRSDSPIDWEVLKEYQTTSFMVDGLLFDEYIDEPEELIGQLKRLPFGIHDILLHIFESAWSSSRAGKFDTVGQQQVRAFLELLSTGSIPNFFERDEERRVNALDIRRTQIQTFIEQNFDNLELSIGLISNTFGLSPRYIQQIFAAGNLTPSEYIREVRLKKAARMLREMSNSTLSVTGIAFACGFGSSSYFSTAFRDHFGRSPKEFRAKNEL